MKLHSALWNGNNSAVTSLSYLKGSEQFMLHQQRGEKREQGARPRLHIRATQKPSAPSLQAGVLPTRSSKSMWILRATYSFSRKQAKKLVQVFCVSCRSQSNVLSHRTIQKKNFKLSLTYSAPAAVSAQKNSWLA